VRCAQAHCLIRVLAIPHQLTANARSDSVASRSLLSTSVSYSYSYREDKSPQVADTIQAVQALAP